MASTTFTNAVTLTDAEWFNDVNRLHYTIFADAADVAAARTALGLAVGSNVTHANLIATGTLAVTGAATFSSTIAATSNITGDNIIAQGDVRVPALGRLFLDGGGNTYLVEAAADTVDLIVGATTVFRATTTGLNSCAIGATTPSTGAFTTLSATGHLSLADGFGIIWTSAADTAITGNASTDTIAITTGGSTRGTFGNTGLNSCAIGATTPSTVAGTQFSTVSSATASIGSGVATTIFSASAVGRYDVYAIVSDSGAANYTAFATVISEGTNQRIVANNGGALTITLSGSNVQVTQTSGVAQVVTYGYVKIR